MKHLLIFFFVLCAMNISAQVTMGALEPPHDAALLDLSRVPSQDLGLLMPRVELNLGLTPFQLPTTASDTEEKATGMIVYNLATENTGILDARVYGGLYQWGSKNLTHGASTNGSYKRYTGNPYNGSPEHHSLYDQQADNPLDDIFYLVLTTIPNDWRENPDPTLWGNGESTAAQDDDNGVTAC